MKGSQRSKKKVIYKARPKKSKKFIHKSAEVISSIVEKKPRISAVSPTFLKKYESDFILLLVPLILLFIYLILIAINTIVSSINKQQQLIEGNFFSTIHVYPFVQNIHTPEISAKTAIITDADSQVVIYSKNPRVRFSMASTTKIMTALVALDYYRKDSILTIKTGNVEGSGLRLYPGEQFTFDSLLYAMLLPSANDAAQAIADNYPGGEEAFVQKMNERAAALHLSDTHYADPIGLNDDGNFTTVVDMARLASYAVKNKDFTTVTSTKEKFISTINQTRTFDLHNLNILLGVDGVFGIKTGTTEGAGEVLTTAANINGHTFIIVVMNSTDRFADTKILLDFISTNVKYIAPAYQSSDPSAERQR